MTELTCHENKIPIILVAGKDSVQDDGQIRRYVA